MSILILMVPMALLLGFGFVVAFLWSSSKGQFDDLVTPALRVLKEDTISELKKTSTQFESSTKSNYESQNKIGKK